MAPSTGQAVNYDIYKAADSDEVAILLGATFAHRDPPAVAAGVTPEEFEELGEYARGLGFVHVESAPLVRSSYHAEQAPVAAR